MNIKRLIHTLSHRTLQHKTLAKGTNRKLNGVTPEHYHPPYVQPTFADLEWCINSAEDPAMYLHT